MGENSAIEDLIHYYATEFVNAYADAIAYLHKKPSEVLVQIENFNSHLMVALACNASDPKYIENIIKAKGHLRRACLDCYKIVFAEISERIKTYFHGLPQEEVLAIHNIKTLLMSWQNYTDAIRASRKAELECVGSERIDNAIALYRDAVSSGDQLIEAWKTAVE